MYYNLKFLIFYSALFFVATGFAQKISKLPNTSSQENIGLKLQAENTSRTFSLHQNTAPINLARNSGEPKFKKEEASPELFDYSKMPQDVRKKIDKNKLDKKFALSGIAKAYVVRITNCNSLKTMQKKLYFLNTEHGYIRSEFIAAGTVKIIVSTSFNSVYLKEKLKTANIDFSFEDEIYLINNK